jgi:hypothetical protein
MSTPYASFRAILRPFGFLVLVGLCLLAGMGCSTPQTRAKERASSFERLKPEDQRMLLQGKIREGLDEDAVYVALGSPTRVTRGQREGKQEYSWIYSRMVTRTIPAYRPRAVRLSDGRTMVCEDYAPLYETDLVDAFEVIFRAGKVIGWKEL